MAEYRTIRRSFWVDPDIEAMSMPVAHLYLYLITNSYTNNLGVAKLSFKRIAMEAHFENTEEAEKAFRELEKLGKVKQIGEYILLKNFIKHQTNTSPKILKNLKKEAEELPPEVIQQILIWYPYLKDTLSIPYVYPINGVSEPKNTVSVPYGEKEKEKEYEMEYEYEKENEMKMEKEIEKKMEIENEIRNGNIENNSIPLKKDISSQGRKNVENLSKTQSGQQEFREEQVKKYTKIAMEDPFRFKQIAEVLLRTGQRETVKEVIKRAKIELEGLQEEDDIPF